MEATDAAARVPRDGGPPAPFYGRENKAVPSNYHGPSGSGTYRDVTKREDIEALAAVESILPKFKVYASVSDITYAPETALKEGVAMVNTIKEGLQRLELGSKLRQEVWDREVQNLQGQGSPQTLIAVCGATGAGKSSILNAILDDNVVPTSGMRACTAVVTELAYHNKSTIEADISFLSKDEWEQELAVLLHDIADEDGNLKRLTDLKSDAGVAWQKVHAVYPDLIPESLVKMQVNEIINLDAAILSILGTTKKISAKDSKVFAKEISAFIDSKEKKGKKDKKKDKNKDVSPMDRVRQLAGMYASGSSSSNKVSESTAALWPLIRQVNVRCRAKALSTGAVLVDLPGVADANAARNSIAKDYMKKCNCIWILAPITRAVDDKTARDLLGDAFKVQLLNGNYDDHAITFIASKCDDISCSEVIRALKLEDDPTLEEIEDRLGNFRTNISKYKKQKTVADKLIKDFDGELKTIREQLTDNQDHLKALEIGQPFVSKLTKKKPAGNKKKRKSKTSGKKSSPKRRRKSMADSDDDFLDDSDNSDSSSDSEDHGSTDSSDSEESEEGSADEDSDVDIRSADDNSDSDDDMDDVTPEKLKERIKEGKKSIAEIREKRKEARLHKKEATDYLSTSEKGAAKVQKEKNAYCSLKRSEYSRGILKDDFRAGLKDLDDAAAEERDPENFNPNHNIRDYDAIDLPVFTCSSRDYVRLTGQVKGDGGSSCFSNVEHTGVPALQQWCHQLTIASRERAARTFLTHVKAFAQSIQSYVEGNGEVTASDRENLREKWESRDLLGGGDALGIMGQLGNDFGVDLYSINQKVDPYGVPTGVTPRLCKLFAEIVDKCVNDLKQHFKDGLEAKCTAGAVNAAEAALATLDEFTSSMHWSTYRATLRRHGSWRRDLNVELTNPFTRSIAHSWSKVFESDLFAPLQDATLTGIKALLTEVEDSAASGLKERTKMQGDVCVEEACVALTKAIDLVKETMNREQKEISRCMSPHIQGQLVEGYDEALLERGTGSVARQKALFRTYLTGCKDNIFDDGAAVVLDKLTEVAAAIGETLDAAMGNLAQKIEVSLAVLWEGTRDSPAQQRIRDGIVDIVKTIQQQIKMWSDADTAKQTQADKDKESLEAMDED
ncbi:hypothetical protein HYPSUDRAFT_196279 [Hypholoma sublateritium FD-334 SS-4]|uniref:G domain-containing protein n=1 Tax=Hypholoma sublateritium (strain FD-334 SS-4) TaxID=945553 RepID=A0A0D2LPD3_HYPSF|nr:hypothetical protein HYPSUDRAFT_196279 [Hypholoma sublateritium FD-334 SS-4]